MSDDFTKAGSELASLRRQLAEARGNLGLIQERKSKYVMETDIPLQLVKEERQLLERIEELERRVQKSEGTLLMIGLLSEMLSGDQAQVQEAATRMEEWEREREGHLHQAMRGQLLQAMCDPARPVQERASAGDALALIGDPRFRTDAWCLPDEPQLGFVEVSEGPFLMGAREEDIWVLGWELMWGKRGAPQHLVTLPVYYIGRYPVTVAQFQVFVEAGGYQEPRHWKEAESAGDWRGGRVRWVQFRPNRVLHYSTGFRREPLYVECKAVEGWDNEPADFGRQLGLPNHPVVGVTWYEAVAYCRWLTERLRDWPETPEPLATRLRKDGWEVMLPTEAQWEKAARGGKEIPNRGSWIRNPNPGRAFPWGNGADADRANYDETEIGTTSAVGCFPGGASPYQVEDLSGNVREWTRSLYRGYPYGPKDGREDLGAREDVRRVLRGGAFDSAGGDVTCDVRDMSNPNHRFAIYGFRLVTSSAPG